MNANQISTLNKKEKPQGNINNHNISQETNHSATLSIFEKPFNDASRLEKMVKDSHENLKENNNIYIKLLNKIGKLQTHVKYTSVEWFNLQYIETEVRSLLIKQMDKLDILNKLNNEYKKSPQNNTTKDSSIGDKELILELTSQLKKKLSQFNATEVSNLDFARLLELNVQVRNTFTSKEQKTPQEIDDLLKSINIEVNNFNSVSDDIDVLFKEYLKKTVDIQDKRLSIIDKTYQLELKAKQLAITHRDTTNKIKELLESLNNENSNYHKDENTINKISKYISELNIDNAEIQYLILNMKKTKKHKNLNHTIEHFENYKEFDRNAFIESQSNNNKFSLLTESLKSFDRFKMNIELTIKNQILTSELMPPFIYVDKDRHHENIENKLDELFNLIYQRIQIELKNEAGLYKNKQIFLYEIDKLENDMSIIKDNLSNYLAENTILKNPKKIRKDIEYLISQHYDLLIKTKVSLRLINLELNNNLYLSSQSSSPMPFIINFNEEDVNIAIEYENLNMKADTYISQIHNFVPLKSVSSETSERNYYQTISDKINALRNTTALIESLNEKIDLKQNPDMSIDIDKRNTLIIQQKDEEINLTEFIYQNLDYSDRKWSHRDTLSLVKEIYQTDSKIREKKLLMEQKGKIHLLGIHNGLTNTNDYYNLADTLVRFIAGFSQQMISSNFNPETSNNTLPQVLVPIRN
ncbi:hypothetical protein [Providencia rettgeri]|uniref:hypothetical protein n=1 Tax=Providencia rettgeri TaxID=587 RepID=UPI0018C7DE46|nr:hypothetical protein [Providencia rettgeri]MBG5900618.1 hypothetical protein [Providencia rettgeri]